jgi:hypothetical protein
MPDVQRLSLGGKYCCLHFKEERLESPSGKCTGQNSNLDLAKRSCSFQRCQNCPWILKTVYHPKLGDKDQSPGTGASPWPTPASPAGGATLTPGIAHSPQSFLLMATNCKMHFPETGCVILFPLSSLFHLWTGTQNSKGCSFHPRWQRNNDFSLTKYTFT